MALAAIASGAEVIEKHIGLDKQTKGLDVKFSLKGRQIKQFIKKINLTHKLLGKNYFYRNPSESASKIFRRSIFAVKDINKGEYFTEQNIKRIRPGYGLEPKYYDSLIGKKSKKNISKGEPIKKL